MRFLPLILLVLATPALAGDLVKDERRLWSDGSPQEVWTYDGSIAPENLVLKELFWEDGTKRSEAEFVAGVQHGDARTWHQNGNKHVEEAWKDGGRHGAVVHWPDPHDDKDRKKQLKPILEAQWQDGKEHGLWQEWKGWGDDRWMTREVTFAEGLMDGTETLWRDADAMQRKHSWKAGALHGRQLAWDSSGQMAYQYNFADGQPEGPQRKYEGDRVLQELFFVDGLLHGDQTWEHWQQELGVAWRDGILAREVRDEDAGNRLVSIKRSTFVPDPYLARDGTLRFQGKTTALDTLYFDDQERIERFQVQTSERAWIQWYPDGWMKAVGDGQPGRPKTFELTFYEGGALHREMTYVDTKKEGVWKTWDRQGRLIQEQTWDFYLSGQRVYLWHNDEQKAAEGDIQHGHGSASGSKDGTWTYWREDGSLLRTEEYGPGPYSGNRPFIVKMVQYDQQERPEFEGSERELFHYTYDPDDEELVRIKRTIKLLDRSRFSVDVWDSEAQEMKRRAVDQPTELVEGAEVVEVLGARGVVLAKERFRSDGSRKSIERFNKAGERHGAQEGWRRDGSPRYAFEYFRGTLRAAKEWDAAGAEVEPRADRFEP